MSKANEAANVYRNTHRPWLRKNELNGEWCSESTCHDRDGFLAGVKWAVEQMRFSPMMEDKDGHGYVKFADLVALLEDEKK